MITENERSSSDCIAYMIVVISAAMIGFGTPYEDLFFLNVTSRTISATERVGCEGVWVQTSIWNLEAYRSHMWTSA